MIRWSYVLPRLVVVALLLAALVWGVEPAARWSARRLGLALVGRSADLESFQVAWRQGRIEVRGASFAAVDGEDGSPLSVASAAIELDPSELLHRRFVFRDAEINDLRVDVDRLDDLVVREIDDDARATPSPALDLWTDGLRESVDGWLEQAAAGLSDELLAGLESPPLADRLVDQWTERWETTRRDATAASEAAQALSQELQGAATNPLRRLDTLQDDLHRIQTVQRDVTELRSRLAGYSQSAQDDLRELDAAKNRDVERLKQRGRIDALDGELLGRVLVGEQIAGPMHLASEMVRMFRAAAPYLKNRWKPQAQNQRFADFSPAHPAADFLVQKARIAGVLEFDRRDIPFDARAASATWQMDRTGAPLDLQATLGANGQIGVAAQLDYRDLAAPKETVAWKQQGLSLKTESLGRPDALALNADGVGVIAGRFAFDRDQVTGRIRLAVREASLQIHSERPGLAPAASAIAAGLAGIDQFSADVELEGDLDQLALMIHTDLGSRIATAANQAVRQTVAARAAEAEQLLSEQVAARRGELLASLQQQQHSIADLIAAGEGRMASLATLVTELRDAKGGPLSEAFSRRLR